MIMVFYSSCLSDYLFFSTSINSVVPLRTKQFMWSSVVGNIYKYRPTKQQFAFFFYQRIGTTGIIADTKLPYFLCINNGFGNIRVSMQVTGSYQLGNKILI